MGKPSCTTSTVRFAKCGERYRAWAKPKPAISRRTTSPPICVSGSRMASSSANTLLLKTCSTGTLYGSHFSAKRWKKTFYKCRRRRWLTSSRTDTKHVDLSPVIVLLRQHALNLHFQHCFEVRWRRNVKQVRRVLLHPVIFCHHLKRFLDIELLRS